MNKNYQDMIEGRPHSGADPYLVELKVRCSKAKAKLDAIPNENMTERFAANSELFAPGTSACLVLSPFNIQYGIHVKIGEFSFVNFGATFLDSAPITIGNWVAIGPNVKLLTDTHPVNPAQRFQRPDEGSPLPFKIINLALPITIEDKAWIGAGAIIMPGITIGEGAMVAAGSVVTRDVAPGTVVAGNPARYLKDVVDPSLQIDIPNHLSAPF